MSSSDQQLSAILNGKWQPHDDDKYKLMLDGDPRRRFSWVGGAVAGSDTPTEYNVKPQPSSGTWFVEGSTLVLCGQGERIAHTIEHNVDGTEITLTRRPNGRSRRFTRTGDTPTEHPARKAARERHLGA